MPQWLKYANRALAVVYLLGMALLFTSFIGQPPTAEAITWRSAWQSLGTLAAAMWLGWQAGRESKVEHCAAGHTKE